MAPIFPNRRSNRETRMRMRPSIASSGETGSSGFARQETVFVIGSKPFYLAVKRGLDLAGGFAIVGTFPMDDLSTCIRRSKLLGQTPRVAVIHEPPGDRDHADRAAHLVLESYPGCGIVLVSGSELDAESERRMHVHDYNAIVVPENTVKHPESLAQGLRSAITEAGTAGQVA